MVYLNEDPKLLFKEYLVSQFITVSYVVLEQCYPTEHLVYFYLIMLICVFGYSFPLYGVKHLAYTVLCLL